MMMGGGMMTGGELPFCPADAPTIFPTALPSFTPLPTVTPFPSVTPFPTTVGSETIADIVIGNPDFSILEDLLTQAGLLNVLDGDGGFTVFAPTNDAFNALDPATLAALQADPNLLRSVLLYHVLDGVLLSTDFVNGATVPTVNGAPVTTFTNPFSVNDAGIIDADNLASNGVVHVLDAVS